MDTGTAVAKQAHLYRMEMPGHTCPYGLKAMDLLARKGFDVEDHPLTSREATEAFKTEHGVSTTPQIFIGGERVGGYDALRGYLGDPLPKPGTVSYRPVITVFAVAFCMALAAHWAATQQLFGLRVIEWFIAFSMSILAMLKLQDVEKFSTMFLNYDLLARRWVPYGTIYPYAEAGAGILMIAGVLPWLSAPIALFIGTIGAVSVYQAVYIERRELKCACVGGDSNVPLGFLSMTENLAMVGIALWMIVRGVLGS